MCLSENELQQHEKDKMKRTQKTTQTFLFFLFDYYIMFKASFFGEKKIKQNILNRIVFLFFIV